jgi:HEPN domain-containing protein
MSKDEWADETTDFLAYIKADLDMLKKNRDAAVKVANEALYFLNHNDIFKDPQRFNELLTELQEKMEIYVKQQMEMEKRMQALQAQTQAQQQQQPQQHQSIWDKLRSVFRPKAALQQTTEPYRTTDLQEVLKRIRQQFEHHLALLQFQDIGHRRDEILLHWRLFVSHFIGEAINYIQASYEIEEKELRTLREELTRSWIQSESTALAASTNK